MLRPLTGVIDISWPLRYFSNCPKIAFELPIPHATSLRSRPESCAFVTISGTVVGCTSAQSSKAFGNNVTAPQVTTQVYSKPPFFIVGAQRSGTTMLRLMLNSHRNLAVPFESKFVAEFYKRLDDYGDLKRSENRLRLLHDIQQHEAVRRGHLIAATDEQLVLDVSSYPELLARIFSCYASKSGKSRWGDKTPSYVTDIPLLRLLFPECRILHIVRDGRDVAQSMARVSWGSSHVPHLAMDWRRKATLGHKTGITLGRHYLLIRYEHLVLRAEETLKQVCTFLEEPYDPGMLQYHVKAQQEMPSDSMQWHRSSVKPPDPSKVFAWKRDMSQTDKIIFEQLAGDALDLFGYERVTDGPTLRSRLKSVYYRVFRFCYQSVSV